MTVVSDELKGNNMEELTATERVLRSDFDDDTESMLLRGLMSSDCRDCAREAHKALHAIGVM